MIGISGLTYTYPNGTHALEKVDLHIGRGEFIVIAGKNGSGKSTLVRHMNALLIPTEGSVRINGMCTTQKEHHHAIRKAVGMVFQEPDSQFIGMTVEEDIAFGPENLGMPPEKIKELVDQSLKTLGISHLRDQSPRCLSGGQKQKVAVAGVLVMGPQCIIFDEVTSMLDPYARKDMLEAIMHIHAKGDTIIIVTHRLEEAAKADRLIIMDRGRIIADGAPFDVLMQHGCEDYGIEVPPILALSKRLTDAGLIPKPAFTKEELIDALCP